MVKTSYRLENMTAAEIEDAVSLIYRTMNPSESIWARKTMHYHFNCVDNGIDDGRSYFIWRLNKHMSGLVGLHHYLWGPESNIWLSWFAVAPELQRQGHGFALLTAIETIARERGYQKFLVETYDHPDFSKARKFYVAQGFSQAGHIKDYLSDGSSMVVYKKDLNRT